MTGWAEALVWLLVALVLVVGLVWWNVKSLIRIFRLRAGEDDDEDRQ